MESIKHCSAAAAVLPAGAAPLLGDACWDSLSWCFSRVSCCLSWHRCGTGGRLLPCRTPCTIQKNVEPPCDRICWFLDWSYSFVRCLTDAGVVIPEQLPRKFFRWSFSFLSALEDGLSLVMDNLVSWSGPKFVGLRYDGFRLQGVWATTWFFL